MNKKTPSDLVRGLAVDLKRAIDAYDFWNQRSVDTYKTNEKLHKEAGDREDRLLSRIIALQDLLAKTPSTSLPGAAIQVMLAYSKVGVLAVDNEDPWLAKDLKFIEGCLFYALYTLCKEAKVDLSDFGGPYYIEDDDLNMMRQKSVDVLEIAA